MFFDPERWYLVVTKRAVRLSQVAKDNVLKRICGSYRGQTNSLRWHSQPAVIVDDGRVEWMVTLSEKMAPDGKKRMAFVVDATRYKEEGFFADSSVFVE